MSDNTPITRLATHFSEDMAATSALIGEETSSPVPLAAAITNHLFSAGGKRLRPLLLLASARICGYEGEHSRTLAAAAEMIHTATLLHDDVVDRSGLRRGKKTAHVLYGEREAVLGGDFLLGHAFSLIFKTGCAEALGIMAEAAAHLAEGELRQLALCGSALVDEEEYFRIVEGKTASLFAAACEMGAAIAGAPEETRRTLASFGRHFGIAFQLVDDALDYSPGRETTGKAAGNDFREGKMTLPAILAREAASDPGERKFWDDAISAPFRTESEGARAFELVANHGSVAETLSRAEGNARSAEACLGSLPHSSLREMLMEAAKTCTQPAE